MTAADLKRAIEAQDRAEAATARTAHALAEAEERAEETGDAAEIEALRAAYETAEAAADEAPRRRREAEVGTDLADAVRLYSDLYGGGRRR